MQLRGQASVPRVEAFERSDKRIHIQMSVFTARSAVNSHFHTDTDALCETALGRSHCPLQTPVEQLTKTPISAVHSLRLCLSQVPVAGPEPAQDQSQRLRLCE